MESEGPCLGMAGAVGVRIVVNDIALAAIEISAVNGDITCRECVSTGIGNHGQGDAVGGDSGQTVNIGLTVGGSNGKVLGNNVVGVSPYVCGVVDGV